LAGCLEKRPFQRKISSGIVGIDWKGFDKYQGVGEKGQTEYAISGSGGGMATSRCEK
jgi:hypothetical protein